jgi:predicted enzyme related to lactoylglutathione lyase
MRERDGFPPGVPCRIDIESPQPEALVEFYGGLFGWEFENVMPDGALGKYYVARLRARDVCAIGSQMAGPAVPPAWNTYIWVDGADETAALVKDAGGSVLAEPVDVSEAGRMAIFADPSGAVFRVWQPGTHPGAEAVNEPGAWNWSDLNTRDIEGATGFYGKVFGWQARRVDLGFGESFMWRLPGYADFLEQFDPELRTRHKEFGTPEGFSDAIGWMVRTTDQDTPPHWAVTFAVEGTDGVVDRATQLGGTILTPPYEAGPTRAAVVRDPQGAVFTVSAFDPESR